MKIKEMYKNENKNNEYITTLEQKTSYNDPIELVDYYLQEIINLFDYGSCFTPKECKKVLTACIEEYTKHMITKTGGENINRNGENHTLEINVEDLDAIFDRKFSTTKWQQQLLIELVNKKAKRNKHKKIANIEYYIQYLLSFIFE